MLAKSLFHGTLQTGDTASGHCPAQAEFSMQTAQDHSAIDTLHGIKMFRSLSNADCGHVVAAMQRRTVRSGERVFGQGESGDTMLVVIDGILRVEVTDHQGSTATVGKVEAGEVVGEMAVVDPAPRSASVVAATDCILLEMSRADLIALRQSSPTAAAAVVGGVINDVTRRLRNVNRRIDAELDPKSSMSRQQVKVGLNAMQTNPNTAGTFFGRMWDKFKR